MDLEELYDKVYRYCYMKLRHPQAAEDITQEAFLRFLRVYEEREIRKRTAYLYTIAPQPLYGLLPRKAGRPPGAGGTNPLRGPG